MELIDKAAVVAEIKRIEEQNPHIQHGDMMVNRDRSIRCNLLEDLLDFLDTLEVKEVDLDFQRFAKEMDYIFALPSSETKNTEEEPLNWEYAIAKHFFELGLKVQKGE